MRRWTFPAALGSLLGALACGPADLPPYLRVLPDGGTSAADGGGSGLDDGPLTGLMDGGMRDAARPRDDEDERDEDEDEADDEGAQEPAPVPVDAGKRDAGDAGRDAGRGTAREPTFPLPRRDGGPRIE